MSAPAYKRASSYGRPSGGAGRGRRSAASGYRGASYVHTATAEALPDYSFGPDIAVVPGAGRAAEPAGLPQHLLTLAKLCAVAAILVALVAVVRVGLTAAAAATALETKEIVANIDDARAQGSELEVNQSVLSNPTRIRAQAQSLGMAAPTDEFSDQVILPDDVVATDAAGNLSLSESTKALIRQKAAS